MRRTILQVSLALFTFTVGFLTSGSYEDLPVALPVALVVFTLIKTIGNSDPEFHYMRVAVLTLLIWIPFAAITLHIALPLRTCEVYMPESARPSNQSGEKRVVTVAETNVDFSDDPGCAYEDADDLSSGAIWVGLLDDRAIVKPQPQYPLLAKTGSIGGAVAVAVIIDAGTGKVVQAKVISGHQPLRQAALDAARQARFTTSHIWRKPLRVSGILTYSFPLR